MIFVLEISVSDRQSLVGSKFYMPPDPSKVSGPYLDLEEENAEDLGEEVQKTNTELEKLKRGIAVTAVIDDAVEFAMNAPDPTPEDAVTDLYA